MTTLTGKWAVHFKTLGTIDCYPSLLIVAKAVAEKTDDPSDFDYYNLHKTCDAVTAHLIAASIHAQERRVKE